MSFGFSVGDFLAAIHTIKRVAEEVQSYKMHPDIFSSSVRNSDSYIARSNACLIFKSQTPIRKQALTGFG
jgi:hypothetical protein